MPVKKREYILLYAVLGLGGIWLVAKFIFGPFHTKLTTLKQTVTLQEAKLKKGISLVENKVVINKEYEKYASYFSLLGSSDETAVASFLKEVEKISRESGLMILDMKPQKEIEKDKFSKQYQINIKAEANMKQLINFLYALHNSHLLFGVEKMTLVPKSEESSNSNIAMTVVGVSFL